MKRGLLFAILMLSGALASCSKDDSTVNPGPTSNKASDYFMPHRAGNTAMYIVTSITKYDTLQAETTRDTTTITALAGTALSDGGRTLMVYLSQERGRAVDTAFAFLGDTELLAYDSTLSDASALIWLKAPLAVGTTWKASAADTSTWAITSTSETVATPAGTFTKVIRTTCKQSDPSGSTMTMEYFFAAGVGLVKMSMNTRAVLGSIVMTIDVVMLMQSKNY